MKKLSCGETNETAEELRDLGMTIFKLGFPRDKMSSFMALMDVIEVAAVPASEKYADEADESCDINDNLLFKAG